METSNMAPTIEDSKKTTRTVLLVAHGVAFALMTLGLIMLAIYGGGGSDNPDRASLAWPIVIEIGVMLMLILGFVALFYKNPTLLRIYAIVLCFFIAIILINIFITESAMAVVFILIAIAVAAVAAFFAYTLASHYEALELALSLPPSSPPSHIITSSKSPAQPAGITVEKHTSATQQVQQAPASGATQPHAAKTNSVHQVPASGAPQPPASKTSSVQQAPASGATQAHASKTSLTQTQTSIKVTSKTN